MHQCYLGSGRLAVLERWLPNTVTVLDRFNCNNMSGIEREGNSHSL